MTRSADLYAMAEDLFLRHEYRAAWRLYQAGDELAVGEAYAAEVTSLERRQLETLVPPEAT